MADIYEWNKDQPKIDHQHKRSRELKETEQVLENAEYVDAEIMRDKGGWTHIKIHTPGKQTEMLISPHGQGFLVTPAGDIDIQNPSNTRTYTKGGQTLTVDNNSDNKIAGHNRQSVGGGQHTEIKGHSTELVGGTKVGALSMMGRGIYTLGAYGVNAANGVALGVNTKDGSENVVKIYGLPDGNIRLEQTKNGNMIDIAPDGTIKIIGQKVEIESKSTMKLQSQGNLELLSESGDVITMGQSTKVQRGGVMAPPTTFK